MSHEGSGVSKRLLFVCAGNTCRSPIAAALAESFVPEVVVQSAGLMPGYGIADNAISVVKEMTGLDISDHRPCDVAELDLTGFDCIVALDHMVAEDLAPALPPHVTLVVWDVSDPYGGSLDQYRRCAELIRAHIGHLARDAYASIDQLRKDITRWRGRLSEAEPTYCQGVANRAAKQFEALIKRLANQRIAAMNYDLARLLQQIGYKGGVQTIDKLPLGTVTQLVLEQIKHDEELASACPREFRVAPETD